MKRKIVLNLAVSLDGYIADETGGYEWIVGDGCHDLDTVPKWEHRAFVNDVDLVVMGRTCYEQGLAAEYQDKQVCVATTKDLPDHDNIRFLRGDICGQLVKEAEKEGGIIYLFGGGRLCDCFIKANLIDEYIIGLIPVILGRGIPLFLGGNPAIPLRLMEQYTENGIVILRYCKQ